MKPVGTEDTITKDHTEKPINGPLLPGEYLTGFYSNGRLIPVITVVVYFGTDSWTAPRSLQEQALLTAQ